MDTITKTQRDSIMARETQLREWLGSRCSYRPDELPSWLNPPTNDERTEVELFDFLNDPPSRYFLYIDEPNRLATTWTGKRLGSVQFGREWRDNFGGTRQSVWIKAINGKTYQGTYYKSSGNYARVKAREA